MILPKNIFEETPVFKKTKLKKNLFEIRFKSEVNTLDKKNDNVYLLLKDTEKKSEPDLSLLDLNQSLVGFLKREFLDLGA